MGKRTRTYVSKGPIEDLDVAVYEFKRDELVVLVAYLAYEEEGGIAAVYDLPGQVEGLRKCIATRETYLLA
jgi:hypothetical protein